MLELQKLKSAMETRFNVEITDDKLKGATLVMNRERGLRRRLAELMKSDAPPLTGRELLEMKSTISGIGADPDPSTRRQSLFSKNGAPLPDAKSRVRVLMTGVPVVHGSERVLNIIEDHGGLVVCMEQLQPA